MSIFNTCRSLLNGNCLKNTHFITCQIHKLPIKWVRPEVPSCISKVKSGDLGLEVGIKPEDYALIYEQSEALQSASEMTQKMFKLEYLPRKYTVQKEKEKILDLVKRHKVDKYTPEAQIAILTAEILQLQEHMELHPRNRRSKVFLIHMIDKRAKLLKRLRMWDYRRFEWILEKLNLVYKPRATDEETIGPYRKPAIRKLVKDKCDEIIQGKLNAYKEELKKQQVEFYQEKAEKLAFIRSEELACGQTPSVTEEEIEAIRKKAEELKLYASQNLQK